MATRRTTKEATKQTTKPNGAKFTWFNEDETKPCLGLCNITYLGITFYSVSYMNGKNGLFLSFPKTKGKNGEYYSNVFVPEEHSRKMLEFATAAYEDESGTFTATEN